MSAATRVGALVAAALVALAALAAPASAHATLESTTPADRARLEAAPAEVALTFSEPVNAPLGAIQVVGEDGDRVDAGDVRQSGGTVAVSLDGGVGEGAYVVTYRVISADAHPIRGALTFTVGDGPAAAADLVAGALDEDGDRPWEVAGAVARWAAYLGGLLAAGGAAFLALVDPRPGARLAQGRLIGLAAVAALAGVVAALPIAAHLATGLGIGSLFRTGVGGDVLGDGVGASSATVFAGLALLTAGVGAARPATARVLLLLGGAVAVAGFALSGHTATSDPRWLAVGADVVHLWAAAVWFGGLVLLARSLTGGGDGGRVPAGRLVARFSTLATVAIVAVAASGATLGWTEVRTLDGLTGTTYGRLLLAKLAVVTGVVAVAAYNNRRLVPALTASGDGDGVDGGHAGGWRRLRATVSIEAAALVVALAVTAVLVTVTPARALQGGPSSTTVPLGEGSVNVVVDPATTGPNELHLYLLDATGRPADLAPEGLTVSLSLPANDIGPLVREPYRVGPGHLQLDGDDFAVPGTWAVEVVARTSRFSQDVATAEIRVRP